MNWVCEWSGRKRYYELVEGKVVMVKEENINDSSIKEHVNKRNILDVKGVTEKIHTGEDKLGGELSSYQFRLQCRNKIFQQPSCNSPLVGNHVQANMVILPIQYSNSFKEFCLKNYQGCPLLEVINPKEKSKLCKDLDIRNDLPKYWIYKDGVKVDELLDIEDIYDEEHFVTFLLGCSFSWENLLSRKKLTPRQIEENVNVPMYKCTKNFNIPVFINKDNLENAKGVSCKKTTEINDKENNTVGETSSDGVVVTERSFGGNLVVSMRPYRTQDIQSVIDVTRKYPQAHGAPVHIGSPEYLGIVNIEQPDFGDKVTIKPNEVPVFWACGITTQESLMSAKLPFAITHAPGHMLVLDILNSDLELDTF